MLLELNTGKYYVQFHHFKQGELGTMYAMMKGRGTAAVLYKEFPGNSQQEVSTVYSFCNPKDHFERKIGRKYSFAKLVRSMQNLGIISTKEEKKLCWDTYFNNFKKGKQKMIVDILIVFYGFICAVSISFAAQNLAVIANQLIELVNLLKKGK